MDYNLCKVPVTNGANLLNDDRKEQFKYCTTLSGTCLQTKVINREMSL